VGSVAVERSSRRRIVVAVAVTAITLSVAVVAGLASPTTGGTPVIVVARISSWTADLASRLGSVWWLYAFLLGAVAAFNPCGFALLSAYLGLYLNDGRIPSGLGERMRRSVSVAVVVGVTFTAAFGAAGAVFSFASAPIVRALPWIGLAVGIALVLIGGVSLSGRHLVSSLPQRLTVRVGKAAGASSTRGYAAFGLAYAGASLGCTLPLFLALMGTAITSGGPVNARSPSCCTGPGWRRPSASSRSPQAWCASRSSAASAGSEPSSPRPAPVCCCSRAPTSCTTG
jgi:cytochrome c biogenesis protein CcdA